MPINYVNTGTSPNKGNGDTLRTAFNKINANFSFLNTVTSADISSIRGDILPALNTTYSLGSLTKHWNSLYVSTATIDTIYVNTVTINAISIGGIPLTIDTSSNTIVIGEITSSTTSTSLATQSYVIEQILANPGIVGPVGPQGPAVSTGLLTFDGNVGIIGGNTGDPTYPYNLIQLIPDADPYDPNDPVFGGSFVQSGQYLNIYPGTANVLDPRIHISAGAGGDLLLGTTQTNVLVNHLGNVHITSIDPTTGTTYTWNFGIDGGLIFPDGTVQTTASTGTQTINLAVLKAIVAVSTTFADFQTRIANL